MHHATACHQCWDDPSNLWQRSSLPSSVTLVLPNPIQGVFLHWWIWVTVSGDILVTIDGNEPTLTMPIEINTM